MANCDIRMEMTGDWITSQQELSHAAVLWILSLLRSGYPAHHLAEVKPLKELTW
jgi:hypothetical protein